jgi:hypothetical protein
MPANSYPGVNIKKEDLSVISNLNISLSGAAIIEAEYGDDEEIMYLYSTDDLLLYCGDIDNAVNKRSWLAVYKALEDTELVQVLNITKNALYGGILLTDRGLKPFPIGITTRDEDSFNFNFLVSNEVLGTQDGSTLAFNLQVDHPTVYSSYAPVLTFTVDGTDVEVTGTQLGNGTITFTNTNITSAILTNRTGAFPITFANAPDDATNITLTYRKGYNDYVIDDIQAVGDGSTTLFSTTVVNTPITDYNCVLKYTIGSVAYEITGVASGGTITFTDATITSATLNQTTGVFSATFATAPDLNSGITLSYEQTVYPLAALIARSKKTWSVNNGLLITAVDSDTGEITIEEYTKNSESVESLKNTYLVGLTQESKSEAGKNIYIKEVFENDSNYFYGLINDDATVADMLPIVGTAIQYCVGGTNGDTPTDTERVAGIELFEDESIFFKKWIGAGYTSKTIIDAVASLVNLKNVEAFMDTIDGTDVAIKSWMLTTVLVDNMNMNFTAPNYYVTYKGTNYICPVSGLQMDKKARRVKSGQPFMPPSGIGDDKGTLNSVIKPVRYYNKTQTENLHSANVNVGRYFRNYGNVLFSDFSAQKKLSSTSYMNSVETLNEMYRNFDESLLVINFNVINDQTFLQLRTIVESYLRQLQKYEGTIEPDDSDTPWILKIEELNNATTKDARKVVARLIFTFQTLAETVDLTLTYTSNQVYKEIAKK